jgi:hypothetical protein
MAVTFTQAGNWKRLKALVTITAGTPILLWSGQEPIRFHRILIVMLPGSTGKGLVYDDVPLGTAAAQVAAASGTPVPLAPAPADGLSPGGSYSDTSEPGNHIDGRTFAIDGSHTGDTVLVSAWLKV